LITRNACGPVVITMPDIANPPLIDAETLRKSVEDRFGILPNFFRLAPETPEITERLWGFAQAAYLDSPFPSVFKERLFVHLSRFCAVRYCIARHVGFLMGLGRAAGDATASAQSAAEVVNLLRRPFPRGQQLQVYLSLCAACPAPLVEIPRTDSQMEDVIFVIAGHIFLQTSDAPVCLDALKRLLGPLRVQYFLLLLAFIRAAHYWTKVHPELAFEDDLKQLLATHESLAECILNDPEAKSNDVTKSLLDELPALRLEADQAIGLLAAIVDSSDDAIVSKTLNGVITSWNRGAEQLFGYTAQEAVGQHISLIIPINRRDEEATILERLGRGQRIEHFDTVRLHKDGTPLDISLTISPVRDAVGNIVGASKIARNITERKRVERALRESEESLRILADALDTQVQFRTRELQRRNEEVLQQSEQLRSLSVRLLQTQDAERRHIARELHDSAGQTLAALGMALSQLTRETNASPTLAKYVQDAEGLLKSLSQELRTTSYLLHPPLLDEMGLLSALRWYVEGLEQRSGLRIDLRVPDHFERLHGDLELAIFRLVQECLTNIHHHSGSKTAVIRVAREGDKVQVEVQDRGKGISPERLSEIQSHGVGVGIRGMRERIRQFHGELTIESGALGTKIFTTLLAKTHKGQDSVQQLGVA
jgi:PAS domain S-box-containing protein